MADEGPGGLLSRERLFLWISALRCAGRVVSAQLDTPATPTLYPLDTTSLELALTDQFGAAYPLCDRAVWASERAELVVVTLGVMTATAPYTAPLSPGDPTNNVTAVLVCSSPDAAGTLSVVVSVGSEARPATFAVTVAVDDEGPIAVQHGTADLAVASGRPCMAWAVLLLH